MERGKARADTANPYRKVWCGEARGSAPSSRNCEVSSTEAAALADRLVLARKFL
jgi:hypothetical protein